MEDDIRRMLEENRAAIQEVREISEKTAKYLKWLRVMDILKLLLILIPIVAAWLYLPQIVDLFTAGYQGILPPNLLR